MALALSLNGQAVGATNQWRRCILLFPQKAPMFRFGSAMAGFLFGSPKRDASKNREMGGALDLGGRRLMMAYSNQPRISGVGGRAHGETPFQRLGRRIERQKINKHEIHHGLRQPSINNCSHSNQPKTGSRNGVKYGGEVRREGRVGEVRYHHFGGVVS